MKFSFYTLLGALIALIMVILGVFDTSGLYKLPDPFKSVGGAAIFISFPSLMIVFGGVLFGSFVMFPFHQVLNALRKLIYIFSHSNSRKDVLITFVNTLLNRISLCKSDKEKFKQALSDKEILDFEKLMVEMFETNYSKHDMAQLASARLDLEHSNDSIRADILGSMGMFAPAFGMFGTIVGLVTMLQNLEDAANVGPALAVALITTLYGLIISNFIFIPVSRKIKEYANFELLRNQLIKEAYILLKENRSMLYIQDSLYSKIGLNSDQMNK